MVDYTHWSHIADSDDEEISSPTRSSVERMLEEVQAQRLDLIMRRQCNEANRLVYRLKLAKRKVKASVGKSKLAQLENVLKKLDEEENSLIMRQNSLYKNPVMRGPSRIGFSKSWINSHPPADEKPNMSEQSRPTIEAIKKTPQKDISNREEQMNNFEKIHRMVLIQYSLLRTEEEFMNYLLEHPHLVCIEAAAYLMNQGMLLIFRSHFDEMAMVMRQVMILQFIHGISEATKKPIQICITTFFLRLMQPGSQFRNPFENEVNAIKWQLLTRAAEKMLTRSKLKIPGLKNVS